MILILEDPSGTRVPTTLEQYIRWLAADIRGRSNNKLKLFLVEKNCEKLYTQEER